MILARDFISGAGKMVEWIKYSAYGTPTALPTGDTDSDGDFDLTDLGNMSGGYEVRKDTELDGDVDANDVNYAIGYGYLTLGRGVLSASGIANRKGYAGYENDGAIARFAHVRHRVLDSTLGRWTRRDPIGYVDGSSLYEYVRSAAIDRLDSSGLLALPGNACNGYNGNIHENTCSPSASGSDPWDCAITCAQCLAALIRLGFSCGSNQISLIRCLLSIISTGINLPTTCVGCINCLIGYVPPSTPDPGPPDLPDPDARPDACVVQCRALHDYWNERCGKCPGLAILPCKNKSDLELIACEERCRAGGDNAINSYNCAMCALIRSKRCKVPDRCKLPPLDQCRNEFDIPEMPADDLEDPPPGPPPVPKSIQY